MKNQIIIALLIITLAACAPAVTSAPPVNVVDSQSTAFANAWTQAWQTQTALPTATPTPPPHPTSTQILFIVEPTVLTSTPSKTPTIISTYEADHEAIRKVIAAYFDQIYYMHNSFQVEGLSDVISSDPDGRSFLKTELRKLARRIVWERKNLLRYSSYSYTLDYSEIVVFDSGQKARANFTEGNRVVYEVSMPRGWDSQKSGIRHIINLRKEQDGWKIIYDVYDESSHGSLYAPTPFPQDVLNGLDKELLDSNQGQGGPALPQILKTYISSDPAQLEGWKEYETALAEKLMPQSPPDKVLCEWELTKKFEEKIYVWAVCMATAPSANLGNYYFPAASVPVVINLDSSGAMQSMEIPAYGENYLSDLRKLFPNGAWRDYPNILAMEKHLHWRRINRTEPPLIVLNATAILTVTPVVTPTP